MPRYQLTHRSQYEVSPEAPCWCCAVDYDYDQILVYDSLKYDYFYIEFTRARYSYDHDFGYDPPWRYDTEDGETDTGSLPGNCDDLTDEAQARRCKWRYTKSTLTDKCLTDFIETSKIFKDYHIEGYHGYDQAFPGYRETREFALREQDDASSAELGFSQLSDIMLTKPFYFLQ